MVVNFENSLRVYRAYSVDSGIHKVGQVWGQPEVLEKAIEVFTNLDANTNDWQKQLAKTKATKNEEGGKQ